MEPIINLNELAMKATEFEGGEEQVNLFQMKDAMRAIFDALAPYNDEQIIEAIRRSEVQQKYDKALADENDRKALQKNNEQ